MIDVNARFFLFSIHSVILFDPLSPPLRSPQQRPQGHPAKSKFLAILESDLGEKNDLSKKEPGKTKELLGMLRGYLDEVGAVQE